MSSFQNLEVHDWLYIGVGTAVSLAAVLLLMVLTWHALAALNRSRVRRHIAKEGGRVITVCSCGLYDGAAKQDTSMVEVVYADAQGAERRERCRVSLLGCVQVGDRPATPPDTAPDPAI